MCLFSELQAFSNNAAKSHEEIIAETKRRLEKSRLKKEAEIKLQKELKRQRKKSTSQSSPDKKKTEKVDSNSAGNIC